jgi:phosphoglycolate phosphatase
VEGIYGVRQDKRETLNSENSIFFDLDGTVCDPCEGIVRCLQYALKQLGHAIPPDAQLLRYIGPPLYDSFAALLNSNDAQLIKRAVESYRERFDSIGMFENSVYPGITDLLAGLHPGHYRRYVVTTKPTVFARKILSHFGLAADFLNIYGSELDGSRADKSDLIAHVLEREQIIPTETVMIGDREHDIQGAIANGVRPIGVLWGYGSREELIRAGATLLCETPQSLLAHLRK